jgi:hypothetical protein
MERVLDSPMNEENIEPLDCSKIPPPAVRP